MKKKYKLIAAAMLAVFLVAAFAYSLMQPVEVGVYQIEKMTFSDYLEEDGKVVTLEEAEVYALYPGIVKEIKVQDGQQVEKGEVLAVLESEALIHQLNILKKQEKQMLASLEQEFTVGLDSQIVVQEYLLKDAENTLAIAQEDFERFKNLYESGAVSQSDLEKTEKVYLTAESYYQQQETQLNMLQKNAEPLEDYYKASLGALREQMELLRFQISEMSLKAPMAGVIAELDIKMGEYLSNMAPALKIYGDDQYLIESYVAATDAYEVNLETPVEFVLEKGIEKISFSGRVGFIAQTAEEIISNLGLKEQKIKILVQSEVAAQELLLPGLEVEVRFEKFNLEDQLVIPKSSIFKNGKNEAVWKISDGKVEIADIETGITGDKEIAVKSGLDPGDLIVIDPQRDGLAPGKRIKVRNSQITL